MSSYRSRRVPTGVMKARPHRRLSGGQAGASIRFPGRQQRRPHRGQRSGHLQAAPGAERRLQPGLPGRAGGPRHGGSAPRLTVPSWKRSGLGVIPKLAISDRATLCLPLHALEDTLEEQRLGDSAYGSTRQGIAPAYGDRAKKAILVGWAETAGRAGQAHPVHAGLETAADEALYPDFNSPRPPRRWPTGCWKCPLLAGRRLQRQHAPQGTASRRQDPAVRSPAGCRP